MLTNENASPRPRSDAVTEVLPRTTAGTVIMPRVRRPVPPARENAPTVAERSVRYPSWQQALIFLLPASLTLAIGARGIADRQLWNDEYATWHAATLGWTELSRLLDHVDRVLGLYYVLMHGWVSLVGDDPSMLRLPSLVAMSCAAGCTALVGQRLFDWYAGLTAGVIFGLVPSVSRYAQEARPYALAVAAVTLGTALLLVSLERPRWPWWFAYSFSMVLACAFHLVAGLVLAAHAIIFWLRYQRSERDVRLWKYLGALALIAAVALPLIHSGSDQSGSIDWIKADGATVVELPRRLFGSYRSAAAVCALGLLGLLGLPFVRRRGTMVALLVWALFPPLFTFVTFPLLHLFLYRYFLFTLPAWALLAAGGLHAMTRLIFRRSWPQLLVAVAALPGLTLLTLPGQREAREPVVEWEPDFRSAARMMAPKVRPGDAIVYAGRARPPRLAMSYELRDGGLPADIFLTRSPAERGSFAGQECDVTLSCLGDHQRIWLVSSSASQQPWSEMSRDRAATLSKLFQIVQEERFPRVQVYLLVRKPKR
ncbi:glycosyltransferase family 39 protein [Micromonospora sp. CB01531]|uniref:glycosyltransferase family 39 protein n=1 Tax=Micromonospora sp. CB01531 TaxID=1718947 RepID=UPI00093F28BE|nr:glycosyltransferase family 39 protein [Micromonospora sp. CB01531]OKI89397.1 hypothetical protein A6A27_01635 [Micromonospora sp. CB01531]